MILLPALCFFARSKPQQVGNHVADFDVLTRSLLISVRVGLTVFVRLWSKSVERTPSRNSIDTARGQISGQDDRLILLPGNTSDTTVALKLGILEDKN